MYFVASRSHIKGKDLICQPFMHWRELNRTNFLLLSDGISSIFLCCRIADASVEKTVYENEMGIEIVPVS